MLRSWGAVVAAAVIASVPCCPQGKGLRTTAEEVFHIAGALGADAQITRLVASLKWAETCQENNYIIK